MLSNENYKKILLAKKSHLSQRQTATLYRIARETVRKYWNGAAIPGVVNKGSGIGPEEPSLQKQRKSLIMREIENYIDKTKDSVAKKQKLTAKMIYENTVKTVSVSYQTICRYVKELNIKDKEIFIPLQFEPGEVMQVDWCEIYVEIAGKKYKCYLFCSVLPYSNSIFSIIMPNMKMESFIRAHIEAFKYYNGTPKLAFYDNLRVAAAFGSGATAIKNKKFAILAAHYDIEPRFMNVNKGNEKGSVENLCNYIRKIAYTPIPKANSLKEIQDFAMTKIINYNKNHHVKTRKESIHEMSIEEQKCLTPLPLKEYNPFNDIPVHLDKFLTFTYDTCKYSLPYEYRNKIITLQFSPYEIFCWCEGKLIMTHTKSLEKNERIYVAEHYLPILNKKRRAIEHAKPLKIGILPASLDTFRAKCKDENKNEQLVKLMLLCEHLDTNTVFKAVDEANKTNKPTYNTVLKLIRILSDDFADNKKVMNDFIEIDNIKVELNQLSEYNELIPVNNTAAIDDNKKD
jgi:hypothetical protein